MRRIEKRGEVNVLCDDYGCSPATKAEAEFFDEITRLRAEVEALRNGLDSIRQYGSDTLSGRTDGPDDRAWQRAAVLEMTNRAIRALKGK
jgi:hypothetical protein